MEAITQIPRMPVCSIRTTTMAMRTATIRSVWSWLFEHSDTQRNVKVSIPAGRSSRRTPRGRLNTAWVLLNEKSIQEENDKDNWICIKEV